MVLTILCEFFRGTTVSATMTVVTSVCDIPATPRGHFKSLGHPGEQKPTQLPPKTSFLISGTFIVNDCMIEDFQGYFSIIVFVIFSM